MGVPVLILGESGTGKTTSLRNFKEGEIAIVNVAGKPLPFRGKFETLNNTTDYKKIANFMTLTKAKRIIIDDCQYIMSFQYMRRIKENGWDKFNELQSDFFNLIDLVSKLPDDVTVYFLSHLETKDDGKQKIKTIGKMLDEKITIEGMFTTVLKTYVADGQYFFLTQNSGNDTVKSPMGMFNSFAIDNDLKYVDDKIRNYYQIGQFKSDDEMAVEDKKVENTEIEQAPNGRIKRTSRTPRVREENTPNSEAVSEPTKRTSTRSVGLVEAKMKEALEANGVSEEIGLKPQIQTAEPVIKEVPEGMIEMPFTVDGEPVYAPVEEPRQRRTRKVRN